MARLYLGAGGGGLRGAGEYSIATNSGKRAAADGDLGAGKPLRDGCVYPWLPWSAGARKDPLRQLRCLYSQGRAAYSDPKKAKLVMGVQGLPEKRRALMGMDRPRAGDTDHEWWY
jgi:hypothetical protein